MRKKHRRTFTHDGQTLDRTFATKREADEWYAQLKKRVERVKAGLPVAFEDLPMKVLAARWIALREKTSDYWEYDDAKMRKALVPALGEKSIRAITKADCEAALHGARQALGFNGATFNRYRQCLHTFFEFVIEEGYRETNPVSRVERMAEVRRGAHVPNELVRAYLERMRAEDPRFFSFLVLGMNTGLRPGEILALTWADFDQALESGRIEIVKRFQRALGKVKEGTKGGGGRSVPLNEFARRALATWRKLSPKTAAEDLIFARADGRPISMSTLDKVHDRVAKVAGLPASVRLYDITRHKFASEVTAKFGLRAAQAMLGHASSSTTERYAHHDPNAIVKQVGENVVVGDGEDTDT